MGVVAPWVKALLPTQPECALFWLRMDAGMVCAHTSHELTCVQVHMCTHMHTDKQTKAWILLGRRESGGSDSQFCSLGPLVKLLMGSPILFCIQPFHPGPQEASRWSDQLPSCVLAQAKGLFRVILCPTTISWLPSFSASQVREPLCFNHRVFLPQSLEAQSPQKSTCNLEQRSGRKGKIESTVCQTIKGLKTARSILPALPWQFLPFVLDNAYAQIGFILIVPNPAQSQATWSWFL